MTLLELLIAVSIMVMVVGTLGVIVKTVQMGFEYSQGRGAATQHARVVLERIARTAGEATANGRFPGFVVLAESTGGWRFPDTLVVWHPAGPAAAPEGLPRLNELVIYCPHPDDSGRLVEITTDDARPLSDEPVNWASQIEAIKRAGDSKVTTLTELMRSGSVDNLSGTDLRGAVRFEVRLRPSQSQWQDSSIPWDQLPWVQGIYSADTGLRQAWLRVELQLMTGEPPAEGATDHRQVIPFFGSAALYYRMDRDERP